MQDFMIKNLIQAPGKDFSTTHSFIILGAFRPTFPVADPLTQFDTKSPDRNTFMQIWSDTGMCACA
jgi:hypothetical protein